MKDLVWWQVQEEPGYYFIYGTSEITHVLFN